MAKPELLFQAKNGRLININTNITAIILASTLAYIPLSFIIPDPITFALYNFIYFSIAIKKAS